MGDREAQAGDHAWAFFCEKYLVFFMKLDVTACGQPKTVMTVWE
jgi:hypothetical protein